MNKNNVNTTRIHSGDIYPTYKELCSVLGEEIKTSHSKDAQLKNWKRFFRYTQKGHKFIIEEIYDTPLPIPIVQRNKSSLCADLMYPVLLYAMSKPFDAYIDPDSIPKKTNFLCTPKIPLLQTLGFINDNFTKQPTFRGSSPTKFEDDIPFNKIPFDVDDNKQNNILRNEIHRICMSPIYQYLDRGLQNLQKRKLIKFKQTYLYGTDFDKVYLSDSVYTTRIKAAELDALNKIGCTTTAAARMYGHFLRFSVAFRRILKERYDIVQIQKVYFIQPCGNYEHQLDKLYEESEVNDFDDIDNLTDRKRQLLNDKMTELAMHSIDKAYQEYLKGANTQKRDNYIEAVTEYLIAHNVEPLPPFNVEPARAEIIKQECLKFLNDYIKINLKIYTGES